jgi:hypothetical protein
MREFYLKIKIRKDTLNLSAVQINDLKFRDRFTIESSTPLATVENSKISLLNKAKLQFLYY